MFFVTKGLTGYRNGLISSLGAKPNIRLGRILNLSDGMPDVWLHIRTDKIFCHIPDIWPDTG